MRLHVGWSAREVEAGEGVPHAKELLSPRAEASVSEDG